MSEDDLAVILASMRTVLADLIEERIALPEKIRDAKATGDSCQLKRLLSRDELLPRLIAEVDWKPTHLAATLDRVRSHANTLHDPYHQGEDRTAGLGSGVDGHPWHGHSQYL